MKTRIQETIEECLADDENIILADGFESCFVGIARQFGKPFAVYDRNSCIIELMEQEMSQEEAEEYMSFNTEGAWVGENTPAFLTRPYDDEEDLRTEIETLKLTLAAWKSCAADLAGQVGCECSPKPCTECMVALGAYAVMKKLT